MVPGGLTIVAKLETYDDDDDDNDQAEPEQVQEEQDGGGLVLGAAFSLAEPDQDLQEADPVATDNPTDPDLSDQLTEDDRQSLLRSMQESFDEVQVQAPVRASTTPDPCLEISFFGSSVSELQSVDPKLVIPDPTAPRTAAPVASATSATAATVKPVQTITFVSAEELKGETNRLSR